MATKRKMPSKDQINAYWIDVLIQEDKYWAEDGEPVCCFACGWEGAVQRCHILPKCDGGSDDVQNLHILCRYCHDASEAIFGEEYWQWFKRRRFIDTATIAITNNLGYGAVDDLSLLDSDVITRNQFIERHPQSEKWLKAAETWIETQRATT